MKQILVFLFIILCSATGFAQKDLDFAFQTAYIIVFNETVDSFATDSLKRIAKPGTKVENVIDRDTIQIREGGLRYLSKQGNNVVVYDPNYPKTQGRYTVEYAGWVKTSVTIPIVKYNILNKDGTILGLFTADLFNQEFVITLPTQLIFYSNR